MPSSYFKDEVSVQFASRFPSQKQLASVYAIAVVFVYAFSIIRFFWRVPSLINSLTVGQIGVMFSYMIVTNLIESLILVAIPIFLSLVLPQKWFFEQFIAKGVLFLSLFLGYFLYVSQFINTEQDFPYPYFKILPVIILGILILVFILPRIKAIATFLEWIADKLEVFLIISIPISVIALIVILIRNIF